VKELLSILGKIGLGVLFAADGMLYASERRQAFEALEQHQFESAEAHFRAMAKTLYAQQMHERGIDPPLVA
jgi:hypothetical protein